MNKQNKNKNQLFKIHIFYLFIHLFLYFLGKEIMTTIVNLIYKTFKEIVNTHRLKDFYNFIIFIYFGN